ncbi:MULTISPECIES: hypothetical protein [unclassified Streptomyces]|uniref:hypothetical protein n=1 Tax=unclassified Streptomyces TaxID=2593676 RepID=UPI0027417564|nr:MULTISPECIES: hypothetical protein [unclassified Streptomyces]
MTTIRTVGIRRGAVPVALLAVLAAGCGTERAGDDVGAHGPSRTAAATPSASANVPCPGESPTPSATATTADTRVPDTPPTDHYAENHGFRVPIQLYGRRRCDGLAAVARIEKALEPLRRRGDFTQDSTRRVLTGLGYDAGKVEAYRNGTGVGFLVEAPTMCLEGTMNTASIQADAFGGYPDGSDCRPPRGGH